MNLVPNCSLTSLRVFIESWPNPSFFAMWAPNSVSSYDKASLLESAAKYVLDS